MKGKIVNNRTIIGEISVVSKMFINKRCRLCEMKKANMCKGKMIITSNPCKKLNKPNRGLIFMEHEAD